MDIIGQTKLLNKLNTYSLCNLPRVILFIGEAGCGKHLIVDYLAKKFELDMVEITTDDDYAALLEHKYCSIDKFYLINISTFSIKQQNVILKLLEDPGQNMHILLIATNENNILPTVLNRCFKLYFDQYSHDELRQIKDYDDYIYDICTTPGKLLSVDETQLKNVLDLCNLIIEKLSSTNFSNALSISARMNYGEFYDKYDIDLFLNVMKYVSFSKYLESLNYTLYKFYLCTTEYIKKYANKSLNKELLMLRYLDKMYSISIE